MVRSASLILSILSLQLMIALYFMIQCYDGNFFVVKNEPPLIANSPVFYNNELETGKFQSKKPTVKDKCYVYKQSCFNLFSQLKTSSNRKLKLRTFELVKNEILDETSPYLNSNSTRHVRDLIESHSNFIQDKKLINLAGKSGDFLVEMLAVKLGVSKLLRLDYTKRPKLFQKSNIEWLNLNEYLNYLLDMKVLEQYDNLVSTSNFKSISLNDLFDLSHCLIKSNGLLIVSLSGVNVTSNSDIFTAWSKMPSVVKSSNDSTPMHDTNNLYVFKKKKLC